MHTPNWAIKASSIPLSKQAHSVLRHPNFAVESCKKSHKNSFWSHRNYYYNSVPFKKKTRLNRGKSLLESWGTTFLPD